MRRTELRIANREEQMANVAAMVEEFGAKHAIPGAIINDINVALDEVLSNIIAYGYPGGERSKILVRLDYEPGRMTVEIQDEGVAFDPLQAPPPDLGSSLHERRVGGVGIHFVRSLMNEVDYSRVGRSNRLR